MAAPRKSDWNGKGQNPSPYDYLIYNLVPEAAIQSRSRRAFPWILENSVENTYDSPQF